MWPNIESKPLPHSLQQCSSSLFFCSIFMCRGRWCNNTLSFIPHWFKVYLWSFDKKVTFLTYIMKVFFFFKQNRKMTKFLWQHCDIDKLSQIILLMEPDSLINLNGCGSTLKFTSCNNWRTNLYIFENFPVSP